MEQNLVSVMIPIYNVEEYLDACIESVCRQTYPNIEIILVDDGSTDRSPQICDEWQEKDPRVRVIHKENGGVSSARNEGIRRASGKYFYFVDSDDIPHPDLLRTVVPYMDEGWDIVSFGYQITDGAGNAQDVHFPGKDYNLDTDDRKTDFIVGPLFRFEIGWNVWNSVFRAEIIRNYQIEFADYKKVVAEDQLFYLCYLAHCRRIKVLDELLYRYVQHEGSLMSNRAAARQVKFGEKNELAIVLKNHYETWEDCRCLLSVFPVIHYLEMEKVVQELEDGSRDIQGIHKTICDDIQRKSDWAFFERNMKACRKYVKVLRRNYSMASTASKLARANAAATGYSALYKLMLTLHGKKNGKQ